MGLDLEWGRESGSAGPAFQRRPPFSPTWWQDLSKGVLSKRSLKKGKAELKRGSLFPETPNFMSGYVCRPQLLPEFMLALNASHPKVMDHGIRNFWMITLQPRNNEKLLKEHTSWQLLIFPLLVDNTVASVGPEHEKAMVNIDSSQREEDHNLEIFRFLHTVVAHLHLEQTAK